MRVKIADWSDGSVNRGIFSAALTVGLITILVKLMAALKEILVARQFGTGDVLDAFLIAFLIPSMAINVIGASLAMSVVPVFVQVKVKEGDEAAKKFFSNVMALTVGLLLSVTVLLSICGPFLLPLLGSGFGAEKLELTRNLYFVLLPILFLNGLSVLLGAILNAIDRFALVTWAQFMTPLTTIAVLLWLGALWGIYALAVGTVAGFAIEAILLARSSARQGISLLPRWNGVTPALGQVQREYMAMIAGALLMSGMGAVDQAMAAMLDSGSVAALSFGNRIVAMLLSVAAGLWVAVLPFFSKMAAEEDWQGIRHTLNTYTKLVLAAGIPVVLLLAYFSEPLVSLLFERGAFTARDTGLVSEVQAYYFLQIPFYVLSLLMMRLVSSLNANRWLVLISGLGFSLNIIMNYVFMQWLGVAGIALSTSLIYAILFICLRLIINRLLPVVAVG